MTLLQVLVSEPRSNPHNLIRSILKPLPPEQQLDHILSLFQAASDHSQVINEAIIVAWCYLLEEELWISRYPTLAALQSAVHFDEVIKPVLDQSQSFATRTIGLFGTIYRNWNSLPENSLPKDICPPSISQHLMRELARLSHVCARDEAISLIKQQIDVRCSTLRPGRRTSQFVQSIDVLKAYETLNPPRKSLTSPFVESTLPQQIQTIDDVLMSDVPDPSISLTPSLQFIPLDQRCLCSDELRQSLAHNVSRLDPSVRLKLFITAYEADIKNICWDHVRLLSRLALGLYTNGLDRHTINARLSYVYNNLGGYDNLGGYRIIVSQKRNWFNRDTTQSIPEDAIAPYRLFSTPLPDPVVYTEAIFERFTGPNVLRRWLEDGTIIIPGLFSYLLTDEILAAIDFEFNVYEHHVRENPGTPSKGFLRNMFYGGIQQLARQDPVWYAVQAAARPDKQWRLVTYPYVARKTPRKGVQDENTGFEHMDINIEKFISDGIGKSQLTSSLSLDNETEDGCTVVVLGFFRRYIEWHQRRIDRKARPAGTTTDASKDYTTEDRREFGKPVPQPCPAGGVRITLPNMIHGSTKKTPNYIFLAYFHRGGPHDFGNTWPAYLGRDLTMSS